MLLAVTVVTMGYMPESIERVIQRIVGRCDWLMIFRESICFDEHDSVLTQKSARENGRMHCGIFIVAMASLITRNLMSMYRDD